MEVRKHLLSNAGYLFIGWISSIVLNFTFQLLAAKTLLPDEMGILATIINFSALLSAILIFGMEQTTQRITAYYREKNKSEYLRSILWFFQLFIFFLNIAAIIGLLLFSSEISQFIKVPKTGLLIGISALLPISLSFFLAGVLRGYQKMRYLAITAIVGDAIKVITVIFLVLLGYKIFGFLIGYLIGITSVFLLRLKTIKLFITKFKIPNIKLTTSYALPSFTTQLLWLLLLNGQYLIISTIQNTYETGLFAVGMILSNQIYFIPKIISDALFPIASQLSANKGLIKQQRNLVNVALRYSLLVSLPALFFVISFPKPLIFLIGKAAFFPAAELVPLLIIASLFFGIGTLLSRTLYAIGKPLILQRISIICALFYLLTSITLTYLFSVLGTSIAYLFTSGLMVIMSLYYLRKYMLFKLDLSSTSKIFISSFLTFTSLYLISFFVPNLIIGGILTMIFTFTYFLILYFLKFYNENDIKILDFLSEKVPVLDRYIRIVKLILLKQIQRKS